MNKTLEELEARVVAARAKCNGVPFPSMLCNDLLAYCKASEQRNAELVKPDFFYDKDDWEYTHHDIGSVCDDIEFHQVVRIGRLVEIESEYAASISDANDPDSHDVSFFDTLDEANNAIEESKARVLAMEEAHKSAEGS